MEYSGNLPSDPVPDEAQRAAEVLTQRLEKVVSCWRALRSDAQSREGLITLHHRLGSLEGAARRAGQPGLAQTAAVAEDRLLAFAEGVRPLGGDALSQVEGVMEDIVRWRPDAAGKGAESGALGKSVSADSSYDPRLVVVLDRLADERRQLTEQLRLLGYQAQAFASAGEIGTALGSVQPDACVVDMATLARDGGGRGSLGDLQGALGWSCPMVVVAEDDNLSARTDAVRAGAKGFFGKPIRVERLVGRLDTLTSRPMEEPYRALVVDDDDMTAHFHARVLGSAGMRVEVLSEPAQLLETLERLQPELVLMDVYMPEYHGAELAEVIRQHELYARIPVVYLSGETDEGLQIAALRRGGQDFLTKPVQPRHLISSVLHLARRYRNQCASDSRDPVTGLLNHSAIRAELRSRLERGDAPLAFALLDIEGVFALNNRFGDAVGDRVLRRMGQLIQQRLGPEAALGRYGGDVFGAILPGSDGLQARRALETLCQQLGEVHHDVAATRFTLGLNAGVAAASKETPFEDLVARAGQALRDSRSAGVGNVHLADA
jgi:diguanylate cyclase (GGDEF)-like protein